MNHPPPRMHGTGSFHYAVTWLAHTLVSYPHFTGLVSRVWGSTPRASPEKTSSGMAFYETYAHKAGLLWHGQQGRS